MQIEMVSPDVLKEAEYNPRTMPDSEMLALKTSLNNNGFVEPLVANSNKDRLNILIGGHQRLKAAKEMGFKEVPVFYIDLNEEAEKALNLGLNKISGRWDEKKLAVVINDIKGSDLLPSTGFTESETSNILDSLLDDFTSPEDEEKLPDEPTSKMGEIYQLGPHRLLCGDSTQPESLIKLLGDERADMVWTDPPYNVNYHSRGQSLKDDGNSSIKNDNLTPEKFKELIDGAFLNMLQFTKEGGVFYICSGWSSYPQFLESMKIGGFELSGVIIWVKNTASMGWNDYRYKHEWIVRASKEKGKPSGTGIIYGWKKGKGHEFFGARDEFDVWEMPRKATSKYLHPTEKPVWLPMRAMRNSTKRDDIILDLFAGSGSVMEAAEKTGRRAFMVEYDERFCDVIRARYERMTNKK